METTEASLTQRQSVAAGVVAVGVSLAVSELLAGLVERVPSAISSIGTYVIDNTPPAIEDWAISTFGTNDKAALYIGTILVALGLGVVAGLGVHRRGFLTAVPFFLGFGAVGLVASLNQALISGVLTVLASFLTVGSGLYVLWWLLAAPRPLQSPAVIGEPTDGLPVDATRRQFMARVTGAGTLAVVGGVFGRRLVTLTRAPDVVLPPAAGTLKEPGVTNSFAVAGLATIISPNDNFYRIDTATFIPRIDETRWSMTIEGLVDNPVEFTFDELLAMDLVEDFVTIACVSNQVGGSLVGNAKWTGVPLVKLLELAEPTEAAEQVVGWSIDGWSSGFPIEAAMDDRGAMVAVAMNDEPLPRRHGFPARLIVPGLYGYVSATKWLDRIELTTWDGFDSYWVPRGWAKEGPIKTQSRIDVPRRRDRLDPAEVTVAGVAWAPLKGIEKVEVRVDEGAWAPAEISEPLSIKAWVQWKTTVTLEEGVHLLSVRATDGDGITQTAQVVPPRPDGATGHHMIAVEAKL